MAGTLETACPSRVLRSVLFLATALGAVDLASA
jgi:hypothetical protein